MATPDDSRRRTIVVEPTTGAEQLSLPGVLPGSVWSRGRRRRLWTWIAIAAIEIVAAALLQRQAETTASQHKPPSPCAPAVVAAPAVRRDLAIYLTGLGTVPPLNTVTVRTQVDDQLLTVR
jgi:hypothetical protein